MDDILPLVSVITPVYNGSRFLEELIKSVLDQDYPRIEHIIVDDGSNDDGLTVQILKKYPHLRWWSRPNKGAYATMNEGLLAATGEFVTLVCSDDKYATKTAISDAVSLFNSDSNCHAVYGETIRVDEYGLPLDDEPPRCVPLFLFRYYPGISHCSLFVRRSVVVGQSILFDEQFPYAADYEWIIRIISMGFRFKRLRKPVALFRQHPTQRSQDGNPSRTEELRRIAEIHGELNPIIVFFVNKWWRLVKLKNLFLHRGFRVSLRAVCVSLTRARMKVT